MSTLLIEANYSSYAGEIGLPYLISQLFLMDAEKGEELDFVNGGKLECPFPCQFNSRE